ncbi:glycosyltransferase [Candidatus Saccharibacteria bacterium]|nr:glycosyltransferase [Candidatus Saccharibacteria bacterium]
MRVLIATAVYYPMVNGVAVFSHNLATGLAQRGNEVAVICPSQTGKNHLKTEDGVKVHYLKSTQARVYPDQIHDVPAKKKLLGKEMPHLFYKHSLRVSVFPARQIKKIMKAFKPDVVHVQVSDPIGLSVVSYARKMNVPVVTTEHNQPEVFTEPLHMPKLIKKPVDAMLSSYFYSRQKKSDFVTMPTKQAIDNLILSRKKEFKVPVAAVSNGVDLSNFKPGKASDEIYEKYKIRKNVPTVVYVGRVDPEKKVGLVVDAFSKVLEKLPEAQLVVVGDGVDRLRIEQNVKKLGALKSIRILGRVLQPDLYELYRVGDVFATASEIETQGIVLIEAAASGLPLIAVNAGAVSEVCITGKNGFLCEPKNVEQISDSIYNILSDKELQKKYSKASLEIAAEHDLEKTIDKFLNIYSRVIKTTK